MWPLHIWVLVLGHMRPASEALTSHMLFGVSKNIDGSIFQDQDST